MFIAKNQKFYLFTIKCYNLPVAIFNLLFMPKRTYQPKKLRRLKKLGYRARKKTKAGRRIIKRRITKGRRKVTVSDEFRLIGKKPKNRNR